MYALCGFRGGLSGDEREPHNDRPFLRTKLVLEVVLRLTKNRIACLTNLAM